MYTRLTSSMKAKNQIQSNTPLTDDQIRQVAPSIFATNPWQEVSDKYTFIPTSETLSAMRAAGFEPFFVAETKPRNGDKQGFTKHMIRYRQAHNILSSGEVPEIIHINSHDRSSANLLMGGFFRTACANGCFAGTLLEDVRVRHSGDVSGNVIEGAYEIIQQFDQVEEALDLMKTKQLDRHQQLAMANTALVLRYPDKEEIKVEPHSALYTRRQEDTDNSVYTTFQKLQENLIKGGVAGIRQVKGINEVTKLNKALFDLALTIAKNV